MIKVTGLDKLKKNLRELAKKAEALDGKHAVPLPSLLTPAFVQSCSSFQNVDEMFEASGFKIESPEDFKAIPDEEWDKFIAKTTSYDNWKEMLAAATRIWTKSQLGM